MPPLVITNAAMVRLIWNKSGAQYAVNVLGAENSGPATFDQALANSLGAAIKASFTSSGFRAFVSTDLELATVGVRSIASGNQPEFTDSGSAVPGGAATDPLPAGTALVITLRTALAGASYRGRVYLPGWAEASNDTDGQCDATSAAAAVAFITAIKGNMTANGLTMAVLSRPREARTIPAVTITAKAGWSTPVNAEVLRDRVWDTQRRRLVPGI